MKFPLKSIVEIPIGNHPGAFGTERKFDIHTGVDLYCKAGDEVVAMISGYVVDVCAFTGESAGTPWWNETKAVTIYSPIIGYIVYGEIETNVQVGDYVEEGEVVGTIVTVLKKDKGRPMNMLHLELYNCKFNMEHKVWGLYESKPKDLLDPTILLKISNEKE